LKPTKGFLDGADHKKEDDHDFLYNIEIKNKLHVKFKRKMDIFTMDGQVCLDLIGNERKVEPKR